MRQLQKILIIQTAHTGDVVLATGLIESIKAQVPDAQIDFLLRKGNESLLIGSHQLNKVLIWDKKKDKYRGLVRLLFTVRKQAYDAVINCQRFAASGLLCGGSAAPYRIGFKNNPLSFLFSHRVEHKIESGVHETDRNHALLKVLGIWDKHLPRLYPPNPKIETKKPYIVIAPASVWFTKQWPEHKWKEFIQAVKLHYFIYIIGSVAEFELGERLSAQSKDSVTNLCGKISLLEAAGVIKHAKMLFCNDSAPLHMASAVDVPTAAIFCSTIPDFGFGPLAEGSAVVESSVELSCRPCGLHGHKSCPKGHFKCAENISVQQLMDILPSAY
jgi:ADP-heptose:LPS heptosyltransferase